MNIINFKKNINTIHMYIIVFIKYIINLIYYFAIQNLSNKWFILFNYISLPQKYVVFNNSYEMRNKETNSTLISFFDDDYNNIKKDYQFNTNYWFVKQNTYYDINKFNIVMAWGMKDKNTGLENKKRIVPLTYIIHFIYLCTAKLTISDIKYMLNSYTNIHHLYIVFI